VATPLELFFDLCFVVAVAAVSDRLHHALVEDEVGHGLIGYLLVFFGIWWAWMNFTWFSSAYDTDDIAYRLTTFVQITGVLILAAGVPRAFDNKDFTVVVAGYVVMRVGLITQWLRAARGDRRGRKTALRFATGVAACQVGWVALLFVPESWLVPLFLVFAAAELAVPVWAERAGNTPWHPHHIAERYGLFTLIVLGETVLSATTAVQRGFAPRDYSSAAVIKPAKGSRSPFHVRCRVRRRAPVRRRMTPAYGVVSGSGSEAGLRAPRRVTASSGGTNLVRSSAVISRAARATGASQSGITLRSRGTSVQPPRPPPRTSSGRPPGGLPAPPRRRTP